MLCSDFVERGLEYPHAPALVDGLFKRLGAALGREVNPPAAGNIAHTLQKVALAEDLAEVSPPTPRTGTLRPKLICIRKPLVHSLICLKRWLGTNPQNWGDILSTAERNT